MPSPVCQTHIGTTSTSPVHNLSVTWLLQLSPGSLSTLCWNTFSLLPTCGSSPCRSTPYLVWSAACPDIAPGVPQDFSFTINSPLPNGFYAFSQYRIGDTVHHEPYQAKGILTLSPGYRRIVSRNQYLHGFPQFQFLILWFRVVVGFWLQIPPSWFPPNTRPIVLASQFLYTDKPGMLPQSPAHASSRQIIFGGRPPRDL